MTSAVHTFVFADLAGFTALTAAHGDEAAADIVFDFTSKVRTILADFKAHEVKTIGDEVMIRVDRPDEAVELALRIVLELAQHGAPPVRVGMHTGVAVERERDFYGATVNLASRVAGAARAGEVLLTEDTRAALSDPAALDLRPRGQRHFKNVPEPVALFAAHAGDAGEDFAIDPVCGMAVSRSKAAARASHHGRDYHFCSRTCEGRFSATPRRYLLSSPRARAARNAFLSHARVFVIAQLLFFLAWAVPALLGSAAFPWFAFVALGWGIPFALHFRAVRSVL